MEAGNPKMEALRAEAGGFTFPVLHRARGSILSRSAAIRDCAHGRSSGVEVPPHPAVPIHRWRTSPAQDVRFSRGCNG